MSMPPVPTPTVVPVVTAPDRMQSWLQTGSLFLIALSLVVLSFKVLFDPAPPRVDTPTTRPDPTPPGVGPPLVIPANPERPAPPPIAPVTPPAPPRPRTDLARVAVAYRDGLGGTFAAMRDRIRSKELANVGAIGTAFRDHGLTLATPLNAAILKHCDQAGNVTDPEGLADEIGAVADALGAK